MGIDEVYSSLATLTAKRGASDFNECSSSQPIFGNKIQYITIAPTIGQSRLIRSLRRDTFNLTSLVIQRLGASVPLPSLEHPIDRYKYGQAS